VPGVVAVYVNSVIVFAEAGAHLKYTPRTPPQIREKGRNRRFFDPFVCFPGGNIGMCIPKIGKGGAMNLNETKAHPRNSVFRPGCRYNSEFDHAGPCEVWPQQARFGVQFPQ
jgi:hypothetical protein